MKTRFRLKIVASNGENSYTRYVYGNNIELLWQRAFPTIRTIFPSSSWSMSSSVVAGAYNKPGIRRVWAVANTKVDFPPYLVTAEFSARKSRCSGCNSVTSEDEGTVCDICYSKVSVGELCDMDA